MSAQKYTVIFIIVLIIAACKNDKEQSPITPPSNGKIQGIILEDGTDFPLSDVKITTFPQTKETHSDSVGYFYLDNLNPGNYMVYAHKPGYDYDSISITVQSDLTSDAEIRLINFSEYLDYYPLDMGNYWVYWSGAVPSFTVEIISDTIISGKMYRVIKEQSLRSEWTNYRYERVDEYNALVYRYFYLAGKEMLIDSLPAKKGQIFSSNIFYDPYITCVSICWEIETGEIFGEIRSVRKLQQFCGTDLPFYHLVKGIGFYSVVFWRAGGYKLKYARIRGEEYGEL